MLGGWSMEICVTVARNDMDVEVTPRPSLQDMHTEKDLNMFRMSTSS